MSVDVELGKEVPLGGGVDGGVGGKVEDMMGRDERMVTTTTLEKSGNLFRSLAALM